MVKVVTAVEAVRVGVEDFRRRMIDDTKPGKGSGPTFLGEPWSMRVVIARLPPNRAYRCLSPPPERLDGDSFL